MSSNSKGFRLDADLLDIVFAHRNKEYGAYNLRRIYPEHLKKSMIIFLLIVIALAGGYRAYDYFKDKIKISNDKPIRKVTELKAPPPIEDKKTPPPPPPPPPPPVKATIQFVPPKIVEVAHEEEEIKTVEEVIDSKAAIANKTVEGVVDNEIGLEEGTGPVQEVKSNEPFTFVEQMPEFPGGDDALLAYLQRNIRYPSYAQENEIEGTVNVEFIVNEDGSISGSKVVSGIKGGCNEEALRVIDKMPRWRPGKQGGQPVRVYYTVPVTFKLED